MALELTDAAFDQEVLKSSTPVLVDFWAPWCGPCRMLAPTIEKLAQDYNGRVKVFKLNTDENQEVAASLGIQSIPTMIFFKAGAVAHRLVGAHSEKEIRTHLDAML